jgi:prepilin-type N-terminal cleavage/methylation domain-containing protein
MNTCWKNRFICRRTRIARAFTLMEVMMALFVFALMALMFSSITMIASRGTRMSNANMQAMTLAQRKLDQLQEAGFTKIYDGTASVPEGLSTIVDAGTPLSSGGGYTYSFATTDKINELFPNNATGTIKISSWGGAAQTVEDNLLLVTVTLTWKEAGKPQSTYELSNFVTRMPMNN